MATTTSIQTDNLRELETQIARLNKIGIALSSEHNLKRLLELIVREARRFTNADGGSLYIREGEKLNFIVAQTESLQRRNGQKNSFRSSYLPLTKESIGGYVAITGKVLNIEDAYLIPPTVEYRLNRDFDRKMNYRTKSMLVVPMRDHKDEIIGVLQLINSMDGDGKVIKFKREYESLILSLASQAAVAIQNAKLIEEIRNLFRSLVRYSAKAIDARSPHTAGHSGRVANCCVRIMEAINQTKTGRFADVEFSPEEIEEMRMAGWLHDIGKIGVREAVLEKENKLSDEQMRTVQSRFNCIRTLEVLRAERQIAELARQGELTPEREQEIRTGTDARLSELADEFDFLQKINFPSYLQPDDVQRLKHIAEKTYTDLDGETHFYLTAKEYENLSVVRGNLTANEYREIQSHVEQTLEILKKIPFTQDLQNLPKYAATHHEMLDGSGYPSGLKGDAIPLQGRIMAICDIYDALTASDRPYKKAVPMQKSLDILRQEAERGRLDKDIVELFIENKLYSRKARLEEDED